MVKRITKNDKKNMKRLFSVMMFAALMFTSCGKDAYHYKDLTPGYGTLSFEGAELTVSEEVETRASVAPDNYMIWVKDSAGNYIDLDTANETVVYTTYGAVKEDGITLPAGDYTLEVQSAAEIQPAVLASYAAVFGAEQEFEIVAGQDTNIEEAIVCTLWKQVKVSVGYNDYFQEKCVSGSAVVTVGDVSMEYPMNYTEAGFFAVDKDQETSIEVTFSGVMKVKEDGVETQKTQKMTAMVPNVKACQWRKIKFILAEDKEGNATFSIDIDGYVVDADLSETVDGSGVETESNGADPNAPQGDGDIRLLNISGLNETTTPTLNEWNSSFTFGNPSFDPTADLKDGEVHTDMDKETYPAEIIIPTNLTSNGVDDNGKPKYLLSFEATVPGKIDSFYVEIVSETIVSQLGVSTLDLINDTSVVKSIASIIPFPYHDPDNNKPLKGETTVLFELGDAVPLLQGLGGEHIFRMKVRDENKKTKTIDLKLVVAK